MIKNYLFTKGPLLAYLECNSIIILAFDLDHLTNIYQKQERTRYYGVAFLRVIGWQTLMDNKVYWVFTYTKGQNWGIGNTLLIQQGAWNLKFLAFKLNHIN